MNHIRHQHNMLAAKQTASGFSLIEVLVSLLILAIGVLGIVALQFKVLQYSHDANIRSQINYLAYDLVDRMRSNRTDAASYISNYTVPTTAGANACTQATGADAANDLACWHNTVDNGLPPTGTANITASGTLYTVALAWSDREGNPHTVNYSFQP